MDIFQLIGDFLHLLAMLLLLMKIHKNRNVVGKNPFIQVFPIELKKCMRSCLSLDTWI